MNVRLSTSTCIYFNRPHGVKATMVESVDRCARAGFRVLDFNFHDANNFLDAFRDERSWRPWIDGIATVAADRGVEFSQAHLPFYNVCHPEAVDSDRQDLLIRRALDCCEVLGIPWAVTHVGTAYGVARPREESVRRNTAYFRPLAQYADSRGVGLAYENLWDLNIAPQVRFGTTAEEICDFVDQIDTSRRGVCWDFEHAALMGQEQSAGLGLVGDRLVATHVSDYINVEADHMLPFHGKLDWKAAMTALASTGYSGDLTFEIHNHLSGVPDELVDSALRHAVSTGQVLLSYLEEAAATA